jgi:hypothetical protein
VLGLAAQSHLQEDIRLTVDGILDFEAQTNKDGVTFIGFWDLLSKNDDLSIAYYLQILDKSGNKLFPDEGKLISDELSRSFTYGDDRAIFTDSDGNALYIVKDRRNGSQGDQNQGYFIYKISPAGELLWDEPVDLDKGVAHYLTANIKVIELANGNYIFAHDIYPDNDRSYIVIDQVSKSGQFIWNEPLLLTDNTTSYKFPFLVDAGSGNFVLVHARGANNQLYAQKFGFDKEAVWNSPATIYTGGFTSGASPFTAVEVISDQNGGCFVGWYDDRYNSQVEKAYVSHVKSDGKQGFIFEGEGLRLSYNDLRAFRPYMCYDPAGKILYAAWEEDNGNQSYRSIVVQKISEEGELLWTDPEGRDGDTFYGLLLDSEGSPNAVAYYSLQLAGEGKIAAFWQHDYNYSTDNIVALLDVSGEQPQYVWPNEKYIFSPKGASKSDLVSLPLTDNEYFLTFWGDFRTSTLLNGEAVFAQKVFLKQESHWNPEEDLRLTVDGILDFEAQTNKDDVTFIAFWDLVAEDPEKQGDRYSDGSDIAYYLQILDKSGNKLFPDEGKLVSHEPTRSFTMGDDKAIFTDSDGNALYIVKDERNWNNSSYPNQGYFVYKLSPAGKFLWSEPVDLDKGEAYFMVSNIKVIEIADGSYIFAHDIHPENKKSYIAIDRVSKSGEFLWDQPLLLTDNATLYSFPFLVDAGSGNFVLVYAKGANYQLYAQKFGFDKEAVWNSPATVYTGGFTSGASPMTAVEVISDQNGGCFVGWYDDRYNSKIEKAYVSHIKSDGKQGFIFEGEGLRLSYNDLRAFRPYMCYDPAGKILYAAWEEDNGNQSYRSIVVQKISEEGELLWTDPEGRDGDTFFGLLLDSGGNPQAVSYYSIQLAGEGKIAVFYQHDYSSGNSTENIAVLLDVTGEQPQYVWSEERLVFSPRGASKEGLVSLPLTDNEYFLTFWGDYRTSTLLNGEAVFAQRVFLDAQTAIHFPETASADNRFRVISNGISGNINFMVDSPKAGEASLYVYSVSGQRMTNIRTQLHAGVNSIPWNVQAISTGVYIAKLVTPNGVYTKRFLVK